MVSGGRQEFGRCGTVVDYGFLLSGACIYLEAEAVSHFTSFTAGGQTALARLLSFLWFQSDRTQEKTEVF